MSTKAGTLQAARGFLRTVCVVAGLTAIIAAGTGVDSLSARFMPVFGFGVIMFFSRRRIADVGQWVSGRPWGWLSVSVITVGLLLGATSVQFLPGVPVDLVAIAHRLPLAGSALLLVAALHAAWFSRFLNSRAVQWLGSRSFSLYLIHEPIVVTWSMLARRPGQLLLTFAVSVPVALVATELFYRAIERPAHRLSRRLARAGRPPGVRPEDCEAPDGEAPGGAFVRASDPGMPLLLPGTPGATPRS